MRILETVIWQKLRNSAIFTSYFVRSNYLCETTKMSVLTVKGWQDKENEILIHPAASKLRSITVFFCGDIQDLEKNMDMHHETRRYSPWSLERTANIFSKYYPDSHIFTIRPSLKLINVLTCYDNFVQSKENVPVMNNYQGALTHLFHLLKNISVQHKSTLSDCPIKFMPLRIIGFSKGCVVLNQILNDMHFLHTKGDGLSHDEEAALRVAESVKEMCWLDGGHNGTKDVWVTNRSVLKTLADHQIEVQAHVSPYQIKCNLRPWIGEEYQEFVTVLKEFGAILTAKVHFGNEKASITRHFQVLKFKE